jgi:Na+/H+ antiporter NhaC
MRSDPTDKTDRLVRHERRGIWLCLGAVLLLGTVLLLDRTTQISSTVRQALLTLLPLGIVFGAIWVNRGQRDLGQSELRENRQAVMHDELRQLAMQRAYKAAFLILLGALAAYAIASAVIQIDWPAQRVAATMVALGTAAFLAAFLFYDRA